VLGLNRSQTFSNPKPYPKKYLSIYTPIPFSRYATFTLVKVKGEIMHSRKKTASSVVILTVLFVLFIGARGKQNRAISSTSLVPEALQYAARGPYLVGLRELVIDGDTPVELSIWYPGWGVDELEEEIMYRYEIKMDDPFGTVTLARFAGRATHNVLYDLSSAPYPLVILSPGFSIGASAYAWLAEHLASYGFVVIAPEHREHLDPENELWQSAITRPQDILTVLAYVDEQVEAGGSLAGLLDNGHVAVIGHSYGGYTSLAAAAGARFDTGSFESQCQEAQESNHSGAWLCEQLVPHLPDMASLAGLDSPPEDLWPVEADPRVNAIVPMAGDAFFFGQPGLAEVTVPVMAIGGTLDTDSPYIWGTYPTYEYASSPRKVRIALTNAEHMIFTGPCENITWFLKFFSDEFCSDTGWSRSYAHALVKHFTTAFLLVELKQNMEAAAVLAPEAVNFPEVVYDAQGY
jgi:predicted dienelactone hydrolase